MLQDPSISLPPLGLILLQLQEDSMTAGGNVCYYIHYGKQYGGYFIK
jgi:hypothetical protein